MIVTEMPEQGLVSRKNPLAALLDSDKTASLSHPDSFAQRHIGPGTEETIVLSRHGIARRG